MVLIRYPKPKELSRIGRLINDGYFNQALKRLRDFEERGNLTTAVKLSTQILRASVILDLGDYNSAFKIVKDTCRECIELNDISHLIDAQNLKILLLYHFGQIDESISLIEENDALITTFSQNSEQGSAELEEKESLLASIKGNVFWDKGDIDLG